MRKFTLLALSLLACAQTNVFAQSVKVDGQAIDLDFSNLPGTSFDIYRATGRYSEKTKIATVDSKTYTDNIGEANPYTYYYFIQQGDNVLDTLSLDQEIFGKNVIIYSPTDDPQKIYNNIDGIGAKMRHEQFDPDRNAFFFKPGDYRKVPTIQVGYYTSIAGLGKLPTDVKTYNFIVPGAMDDYPAHDLTKVPWGDSGNPGSISTNNFWRSIENLSIMEGDADANPGQAEQDHWFKWAVSQAAPLRRIYTNRTTSYDLLAGIASGGFTADSYFAKDAGSYSQQQWYTRNSHVENGVGGFSKGGWNYAYQGTTFGNGVKEENVTDNWGKMVESTDTAAINATKINDKGIRERDNSIGHQWDNVSNVAKTPVIREKPFIFIGDDGRYKVFRPALRKNVDGTSWTLPTDQGDGNMGNGTTLDLLNDFYIAKPGATAAEINSQLSNGKNILFTPGIYTLDEPLEVVNENTIVMGIGYATLIPGKSNSEGAIQVADVPGVTIAGLLFDTEYSSENLLRVGKYTNDMDFSDNPTLLSDLFFRIGGVYTNPVNINQVVLIKDNDVIGDDFWIWRADHGEGTGWNMNTSKNGLVVYGDDVTLYGIFNEHFQEYQTLWYGERGRLYFYQCETPYDPQNQDDYLSHVYKAQTADEQDEQANGYCAYKVAVGVKEHYASMMGIYDVFIYTNNAKMQVRNSIEIPAGEKDVKIHHACNTGISELPGCGFQYIVGDKCKSTYYSNLGAEHAGVAKRCQIVDFDGTMTDLRWKNDVYAPTTKELITNSISNLKADDSKLLRVYPNPCVENVNIEVPARDYTVTLYSVNGERFGSYKNASNINMTGYAPGLYFVKVTTAQGENIVRKIIKK